MSNGDRTSTGNLKLEKTLLKIPIFLQEMFFKRSTHSNIRIKNNTAYSLNIQSCVFLAARAELANQPKSKQIPIKRGNFTYHRFLKTAWLVLKESNIQMNI